MNTNRSADIAVVGAGIVGLAHAYMAGAKGQKIVGRVMAGWLLGSGQMWIAAIGPDTPDFGEIKFPYQVYQKQIAKTIAAFLGLDYVNEKPVGEAIPLLFFTPWLEASIRDELPGDR